MADTLKQVQIDRQRMIENNKGATESSRAALSAISGRLVLKTKTETEKMRRDEALALRQNEALVALNRASGNVALEKSRLDAAQHHEAIELELDRLELADRRLGLRAQSITLDEGRVELERESQERDRQRFELEKKRQKKNEVLTMMNQGVYDPSFATVLGMPEDVVRQAAANKKAQLDQIKAARAKAAQAQADYEAALAARNGAVAKEKAWYETDVDSAIAEAEKNGIVTDSAAETKEQVLSAAKAGQVTIPWATPTNVLTTFSLSGATDVRMSGAKIPETTKKTVEQIKKQVEVEKKESEKRLKAASDYYDQVLTEKIYAKEKASKELSALEASFKKDQEQSTAYQLRMKRFGAVDRMKNATTAEEVTSSYNEYLASVAEESGRVLDDAESVQLTYNEKYENAENYTEEELAYLEELRLRLDDIRTMLEYELEAGGLTEEGKAALLADIDNIGIATANVEEVIGYGEGYEENKSSLIYQKMEKEYGALSISDIEALIAERERQKEDTADLRAILAKGRSTSAEELIDAGERLNAAKEYNADIDKELAPLRNYLEQRKTAEENALQDERAEEDLAGVSGETLTQRTLFLMKEIEASNKRSDGVQVNLPNSFWKWSKEEKCEWFNRTYGTEYKTEDFNVNSAFKALNEKNFNIDATKDLAGYFHRHIVASNETLFTPETLEQYAAQAVADFENADFHKYTGDLIKYNDGIDGLFEGDYSDFRQDMTGFLKGEYGYFNENEAKTILALMAKYGTDEAFVHYAAVRDDALKRKAQEFTGFGRVVRGVTSGLTQFITNGGEMLENAFTQQYSRIAGTLGTASHQINMENFSQKTGIGNDALEMLYMSGYSIIDMAPAVALGAVPYVGTYLSSAYTFAKVTATTYNDSILAGKRADEALTYAMLSATAEVGMEKLLSTGGQTFAKGGLGKIWEEGVENLASTKAMQVIIKTAGSMGSEGFEEFLQECLSPFLEKVAADLNGIDDATLKEIDWEEAAKSFAIGAITGGFLGGFEAVSSSKNAGMKESEARDLLESGKAVDIINAAAELGNKRALAIKQAIQNGQTLYEGQSGYFAYASPADIVNITQSVKRRSVKRSMSILQEKYNALETNKDKQKTFNRLFKKILNGNTLTLQETADIINDQEMSGILNEMLGMDVTMMTPDQVLAVAKLAAFAENGKISQARINLFKDAFGELDTKALAEIVKYSDMAAKKVSGILYEDANAESQLTEAEQESAEVLKILSAEVGTVFYVTDQFDTGTYLAANMMAVRPGDLSGGVFKSATHRAYYMAKQLMADKGVNFKAFLLGEAKRLKGEAFVEEQIKTILQQSTENGNDISRPTAENELCARLLGELLQQEGVLEQLATADLDMVAALRKALAAVEEHLDEKIGELHVDQNLHDYINRVIENRENPDENIEVGEDFEVWKITDQHAQWMAEEIKKEAGIEMDLTGYTIVFPKSQVAHTWRRHGKNGKADSSMSKTEDIAKIRWYLEHSTELKVARHKDGNLKLHRRYKNSDGSKAIMVSLITHLKGTDCYVSECIPDVKNKTMYVLSVYKNSSNNKRMNIEASASPHHTPEASLNDVTAVNNSISNSSENVNYDFGFSFFDGGSAEVTDLVERMTTLINGEKKNAEQSNSKVDHDPTYTDADQVREENDGADFAMNFEEMSPEERDIEGQQMMAEVEAWLTQTNAFDETEQGDPFDTRTMIGAKKRQDDRTAKEKIDDTWNHFRRKWVDYGATVYDMAKKAKDWSIYHYYDSAKSSIQEATYMIEHEQRDLMGNFLGEGLQKIWEPILQQGTEYTREFDDYLLHLHNVDRMSRRDYDAVEEAWNEYQVAKQYLPEELARYSDKDIREIARDVDNPLSDAAQDYIQALDHYELINGIRNKTIFGPNVTAEMSQARAEDLERKYPEFKKYRESVYRYRDNLMQRRVDAGLVSQKTAAKLREIYPHYVPTARVESKAETEYKRSREKNREQVRKTVGRAVGGTSDIIELYQQFADQTMSVVRESRKNIFGVRLLELAQQGKAKGVVEFRKWQDLGIDVETFETRVEDVDPFAKLENKNVFGVFKDGEFWEMDVTNDLFEAVQALENRQIEEHLGHKLGKGHVTLFKRLCTSLNPKFMITNPIRDFADAIFTSKNTRAWMASLPRAIKEIKTNGELWRQYCALGGGYSTIFDFDSMRSQKKGWFKEKVSGRIEVLNQAIEQLPRFAEFMATVKKGDGSMDNLMEAMYNAADITTNFGRAGTTGKFLNRYVIPFFNPAVQGTSKAVRMLTEHGSFKGFFRLGLKAVFFGVAPAVINSLLYSDDEEWETIRQSDKDRYFLFKLKEGLWIRIPKGRMVSVLGAAGERARQAIEGDEVEWASFIDMTVDQLAPSNPVTSNIAGPLWLASMNRTWYGTDIVNERLAQLPNGEQYDAKTDEISKWLGSVTGLSPKKINYVLDAYSGVVGDLLLPALTPAAERTFIEQSFTLDSDYANRLSEDFYTKLDELSDNKNSKNGTALDGAIYRRWSRNASAITEINAEIRRIEEDTTLSGVDKKDLLNAQYAARNALMLNYEDYYEEYSKTAETVAQKTSGMSEESAEQYIYRETNRKVLGTEEALKAYSKAAYERAVRVQKEQGIDFDTFYDVYFAEGEPDTEKCFTLIEAGLEVDTSLEISRRIGALEPEDGKKNVSDLQKYQAIEASDVTDGEKMQAMAVLATDTDRRRLMIGADYNVTLGQFIAVKDNVTYLNDQTEGGVTNALVKAAVNDVDGLNDSQRAALWQLFTGATSGKNNPYSSSVGAKVAAKNKALKKAEEE